MTRNKSDVIASPEPEDGVPHIVIVKGTIPEPVGFKQDAPVIIDGVLHSRELLSEGPLLCSAARTEQVHAVLKGLYHEHPELAAAPIEHVAVEVALQLAGGIDTLTSSRRDLARFRNALGIVVNHMNFSSVRKGRCNVLRGSTDLREEARKTYEERHPATATHAGVSRAQATPRAETRWRNLVTSSMECAAAANSLRAGRKHVPLVRVVGAINGKIATMTPRRVRDTCFVKRRKG